MTAIEPIAGRLLLWATVLVGTAAVGLPDYRPPAQSALLLLAGPVTGTAAFLLLAGKNLPRPRLRLRWPAAGVRWAYFAGAAAVEEVVWRGLVLAGLAPLIGPPAALAVSTAGFAVSHLRTLGRRSPVHLVTGAAFGAAFLVAGLASAILAHAVYNVLVDLAVRSKRARLRGP